MKISVDGGAFCGKKNERFGNYIFGQNLVQSLINYDNKNHYFLYSFCQKPDWLKTDNIKFKKIGPKFFWSSFRVSMEEVFDAKDYYLALNQALPTLTYSKIISFSHGLSFMFFPKFYSDSYQKMKEQVSEMVKRSKWVIVSSEKIKKELLGIYPNAKNIKVLNFGVSFDMLKYEKAKKEKYFLFVGMNHQIKNVEFIVRRFQEFVRDNPHYKLYLVGTFEKYKGIKNIKVIDQFITRRQLKRYYSKATAYLTASFYESFNLPVLESLACGTKAVGMESAIIPELQKYVVVCRNEKEFRAGMKDVVINPEFDYRKDVIRNFSWKNYVGNLIRLYD